MPAFGKLLYLHMSDGYDKSKIAFSRFIETFLPFISDENKGYIH